VSAAVPVRLLKRDLFFVLERLVSVLDENRIEALARLHGIPAEAGRRVLQVENNARHFLTEAAAPRERTSVFI
jgi:hypothetical protein